MRSLDENALRTACVLVQDMQAKRLMKCTASRARPREPTLARVRLARWLRELRDAMRPRRATRKHPLPPSLAGWFSVSEIDDVEVCAGELFRRAFRAPPPLTPHHFVARVEVDGEPRTIGYVHYERLDDVYLCGGMCMDERTFRRLDGERRAALKAAGGVAEQMLRHTFAELAHAKAIFGYVGDRRAERVDLRAGFQHTGLEHLIVHWPRRLAAAERQALIARVAQLGPF